MITKEDVRKGARKVLFKVNKLGGIYEQCEYCEYAAVELVNEVPVCDAHAVKVGEFLDLE